MAAVVPVRRRVVEVEADLGEGRSPRWRYGSGLLVGNNQVLTAAHVVTGAAAIAVRAPDKVRWEANLDAALVGDPDQLDLALLQVPQAETLPGISVAAVDRDVAGGEVVENCWAVGYPQFAEVRREETGQSIRETKEVRGFIAPLSGLVEDLLSLEVTATPRALPAGALDRSEWSGMSGAAVFADGYLIGVIAEHAARRGSSDITVTPLDRLLRPATAPFEASEWWARLGVVDPHGLPVLPMAPPRPGPAYWATSQEGVPPPIASPSPVAPLPPRYVHGLSLPKNWADRSAELAELEPLLQLPTTRVLNLFALGGTGKSTIMRRIVERCAEPGSPFDSLLWFSFYRDEDVERFFLEACRYLVSDFDPSNYPSTFERASLLQSAVQSRSTLIVLDGFERITESSGGPTGVIRISRREIASFLAYILSITSGSKVAITSRVDLDELSDQEGYVGYELADLRPDAARAFLQRGGLGGTHSTLDRLARAYGYHALTLSVLVDYLLLRGLATDLEKVDAPLDFPPDTARAERLDRLLDQYYLHLTTMEVNILSWIAASPRGLSQRQLRVLESIPNASNAAPRDEQRSSALIRLQRSSLVASHDDIGGREPNLFDSHPLLRGYFYSRLSPTERTEIHTALLLLAEVDDVPAEPTTILDIQPRLDMFWHALAIDDVDKAYAVWQDDRVHHRLLWWGNYQAGYDLVERLIESPAFRAGRADRTRGFLLDEAGILLAKLGQPVKAINHFQDAADSLGAFPTERLDVLLNLCELQMEAGRYLDARTTLRQATDQRRSVREFAEFKLVGRHGYLAAALDEPEIAERLLTDAIAQSVATENGAPGYRCLFLRIRGDLYVETEQYGKAEHDYRDALGLATDERWKFVDYEGHLRRGLGDLASNGGRPAEARAHYGAAMDIARRTGYQWLEAEVRSAQARDALTQGGPKEADQLASEAVKMARNGGWLGIEIQGLLTMIASALALGLRSEASELCREVKPLVGRSGKRSYVEGITRLCSEIMMFS